MVRKLIPVALVLLAACARSEDASTLPKEAEGTSREVEHVNQLDMDDQELAIGEWRESLQDDYPALEFGPTGAPPLFSLRCDDRRGVLLQRHGTIPIGDLPMMLVTVGSETRRLAVVNAGGTIPMLRASLPPRDPLLAPLRRAASPIVVRIGDSAPLVLPPSPEIGPFIERCARAEPVAANAADATNELSDEANAAAPATGNSTGE